MVPRHKQTRHGEPVGRACGVHGGVNVAIPAQAGIQPTAANYDPGLGAPAFTGATAILILYKFRRMIFS
jgi:hypothetical protein